MSDNKQISAALVEAQLKMGKLTKNRDNPHYRSKYADLSEVLEVCKMPLNENGIAVVQSSKIDNGCMSVQTRFLHKSGEVLEFNTDILIDRTNPQGSGSALTYGRRYGLMAAVGLAPEDDDGNHASIKSDPKPARKSAPRPASKKNSNDKSAQLQIIGQRLHLALPAGMDDKLKDMLIKVDKTPLEQFQIAGQIAGFINGGESSSVDDFLTEVSTVNGVPGVSSLAEYRTKGSGDGGKLAEEVANKNKKMIANIYTQAMYRLLEWLDKMEGRDDEAAEAALAEKES